MSADSLPNEILQNIFTNVYSGVDLFKCRRVCRRWKDMLDSSENLWQELCRLEYGDTYKDAYRKTCLSWQDLYKSISLWPKAQKSEVNCMKMPIAKLESKKRFQVVQNGVIGIPVFEPNNDTHQDYTHMSSLSNKIVYYDLDTLEECGRETFDFLFSTYEENESVIVVVSDNSELCIVPKVNMKRFFVGELQIAIEVKLFEDEVYFKTSDGQFAVSRLINKDDDVTVKTEKFENFINSPVLAISYPRKDKILILTDDYDDDICNIFSYCPSTNEHELISKIDQENCDLLDELESFGFKWASPIFGWMGRGDCEDDDRVTTSFYYGDITVMGTAGYMLHIYYKLRGPRNEWKPIKSFNMIEMFKFDPRHTEIDQVDVVEMQNGHKMIVLLGGQMFLIEFYHKTQGSDSKDMIRREEKYKRHRQVKSGKQL